MKLVIDSNVLFTFFWKFSAGGNIIALQKLKLYSPEFALQEIRGHLSEILAKTGCSEKEFNNLLEELAKLIEFIPLEKYSSFLPDAAKSLSDKDDVDFIALALRLNCPVWSNDPHLKQQSEVLVFTTAELINLLS